MKSIYVETSIRQEQILNALRKSNTSNGIVMTAKDTSGKFGIKLVFFIDGNEEIFKSYLPVSYAPVVSECREYVLVKNCLASQKTEIRGGIAEFTIALMGRRASITTFACV